MVDDELLEVLRQELSRCRGIRLAFLFGSRATGNARPDSDVDVAFLPDSDWSLPEELALQGRLASAARANVDLVRLDRAGLPVAWEVVKHGVPLVGDHAVVARYQAGIALQHADIAPLLDRSSRHYARRVAEEGIPR